MGSIYADTRLLKHKKQEEQSIQVKVCNYIKREYPHVIFISDYAAGLNLTKNQRGLMMTLRSHDGQPDISIDYPSRGYHGLRIELKKEGTAIYKKDGKTLRKSPYKRVYRKYGKLYIKRGDHLQEQAEALMRYNALGYCARFAVGYDKAIALIDWYMQRPQTQEMF